MKNRIKLILGIALLCSNSLSLASSSVSNEDTVLNKLMLDIALEEGDFTEQGALKVISKGFCNDTDTMYIDTSFRWANKAAEKMLEIELNSKIDNSKKVSCSLPTMFGIELGKTTLREVSEKFKIIRVRDMRGIGCFLDPWGFSVDISGVRITDVVCIKGKDKHEVEYLEVTLSGKCLSKLKELLSQQYKIVDTDEVIKKAEPNAGSIYCYVKVSGNDKYTISLVERPSETLLIYSTNERSFYKFIKEKKKEQQTEADVRSKL